MREHRSVLQQLVDGARKLDSVPSSAWWREHCRPAFPVIDLDIPRVRWWVGHKLYQLVLPAERV